VLANFAPPAIQTRPHHSDQPNPRHRPMRNQIRALAGTDRMTIPAPLLEKLAADTAPLPPALTAAGCAAECRDGDAPLSEGAFRWELANDGAANDKLAAGLRAFAGDTARLVELLRAHPGWN